MVCFKSSVAVASLSLFAAGANALTFNTPQNWNSASTVTVSWNPSPGDPGVFHIELLNTIFHNSFAIADSVATELGSKTITLGVVPIGDGYTLEAVALNNISVVYATSGDFAIGDGSGKPVSSVSSLHTTSAKATSTSSVKSSSIKLVTVTSSSSSSSAGFGVTQAANSSSISATDAGVSSTGSQAALPTNLNGSGHRPTVPLVSATILVLLAFAAL